jgi:3-hydroxyisobutyrate dehydrogenase-like beta-hydroxyacid dehydrogenase
MIDELNRAEAQLQQMGYNVCKVVANAEQVELAMSTGAGSSPAMMSCMEDADVCLFIVSKDATDDDLVVNGIGFAVRSGRDIVVVSDADILPTAIDQYARSVILPGSAQLGNAIAGATIREAPGGGVRPPRSVTRIKCQ